MSVKPLRSRKSTTVCLELATEKAVKKVWELLGFALAWARNGLEA